MKSIVIVVATVGIVVAVIFAGFTPQVEAATAESVDIGMPFAGKWAYGSTVDATVYTEKNSSHPTIHKISGGADWATDIYGREGEDATLAILNASGRTTFAWRSTSTSCGTSTGITVFVDGVNVGWVYFAHLTGAVHSGEITNGMSLGKVGNYACAPGNHVHVEMKSASGYSCFADHGRPGTPLSSGTKLGSLGSTGANGIRAACGPSGASAGGASPERSSESSSSRSGILREKGGSDQEAPMSLMNKDWRLWESPTSTGSKLVFAKNGATVSMQCWDTGVEKDGTKKWFKIKVEESYSHDVGFVPANAVSKQWAASPHCP